jgi:nitrogen fixation/metabolism regulation signal transduction histidine kinase
MFIDTLKRFIGGPLPVVALLMLLLTGLHLMSAAVQNADELDRHFVPLLILIGFGLLALVVLVGINIAQLILRYRRQAAGSGLTLRMVGLFVILALVPVGVVYYHSQQFLLYGIDSWFNVKIDQAMEDAMELSRASLALHQRERLKTTQQLIAEIDGVSITGLTLSLSELRERYGATELLLMEQNGAMISSSNVDITQLVPDRPDDSVLRQVREEGAFVALSPQGDSGILQVRVVLAAPYRPYILQALYPTSVNVTSLTERVQGAYNQYKELSFLRQSLKNSFTLTLALVLLFSVLSAIWAAFYASRRLTSPIIEIADGTREVANGRYGLQLPRPKARDELTFLVSSFNAMSRRIAAARDAADHSQRELALQHTYLETILSRLSSGVIAFDEGRRLGTVNPAARDILAMEERHRPGMPLQELAEISPKLQRFVAVVEGALNDSPGEWRGEIELHGGGGRQVLLCRLTPLSHPENENSGHVLVFDDVTALIRAQQDAAWGGVARRLAHEIKNPLTPIQLSAERLRHKCLPVINQESAPILDRSTATIISQVEAMKQMLDTFSEYARPPKMNPEPLMLDKVLADVLELYRGDTSGVQLEIALAAGDALLMADALRMRQVFHNLLKNAREAAETVEQPCIGVASRVADEAGQRFMEVVITDNGPGFDDQVASRLFEPYVTTKAKGTGLGLAIVKKIVEEHGGTIAAENADEGGARITLRLPLKSRID